MISPSSSMLKNITTQLYVSIVVTGLAPTFMKNLKSSITVALTQGKNCKLECVLPLNLWSMLESVIPKYCRIIGR